MRKILLSLISFCCSNFIVAQSITLAPDVSTFNQDNQVSSLIINSKNYEPFSIKNDKPSISFPLFANTNQFQGSLIGQDENLYVNGKKGLLFFTNNNHRMSLLADGVLIGNAGSAKASLDVDEGNGTLRSKELDFAETISTERRPVYADKDGILRVENSSNHYMSYNFTSVQAQNYDDQIIRGSGFAWFNTTTSPKTLYLPVNLPDGVKVTNVRMYLLDNSASNLSFTFNKNTHVTNTFTSIATAQSSTNTVSIFSINNNANETIDNANNSYYVNISSSGNWTGNTLQFHSLVITYQYQ
ncbi:hypothetical protein [Lacihabitans lacunae]|uniref:Uncharacterized protein n=1 Tax=Lacihabitans lacunae TaxID=1028214 RepID=A0ABV7YQS1_9BACT